MSDSSDVKDDSSKNDKNETFKSKEKFNKKGKFNDKNYERCKRKRQAKGLVMLSKEKEDEIFKLKQTLRKQNVAEEDIRKQVNKVRRHEENRLKRESGKYCFLCRQKGHMVKDCSSRMEYDICYGCGSSEHRLKDCTNKNDKLQFATCYICKLNGHLAKNCPQNKQGVYINGGACHQCGSKLHLYRDCPGKKGVNDEKEEEIKLPTIGNCIESVDAEIELFESKKIVKKPKVVNF